MFEKHPEPALLAQLGRTPLTPEVRRSVVRHLLSGCPRCRAVTARLLPPVHAGHAGDHLAVLPGDGREADYTPAFEAVRRELTRRQAAFAQEQAAAPRLLRELAEHPFERQWMMVTNSPRFQTWAFCDLLLESSRELGFQDPARALETAELGAAVAAQLSFAYYGEARLHDLSARAWATLANAERIRSDFRSADKGFARAERLLKSGTGDPLEKARVLLLKASLRGNQQRFGEAFRLLDRVVALGHRHGDPHLSGKALITKGFVSGVAGRPEAAVELLYQGLALADVASEPRLVVAARHNLALYLNDSGRHDEALALLEQTRPIYEQLGDRMNLVRLQWVEGKIEAARGRLDRAEHLFRQVRIELVERDLGYDAALLSLDLARLLAQQGRGREMRQLAEEMLPIFQSRDIHREAIASLIVFQKAAEMERVTLRLVQELSDYLQKSRSHPDLRFQASF